MTAQITATLNAISRALALDSLNYSVSFMLVKCEKMAGRPLNEVLVRTLGENAVVGASRTAQASEVLASLEEGLVYEGDEGSHPDRKYWASEQFAQDRRNAMAQVSSLLDSANQITSFWLKDGHPFYPVFWDFAFAIEKTNDVFIFIGSSSD